VEIVVGLYQLANTVLQPLYIEVCRLDLLGLGGLTCAL